MGLLSLNLVFYYKSFLLGLASVIGKSIKVVRTHCMLIVVDLHGYVWKLISINRWLVKSILGIIITTLKMKGNTYGHYGHHTRDCLFPLIVCLGEAPTQTSFATMSTPSTDTNIDPLHVNPTHISRTWDISTSAMSLVKLSPKSLLIGLIFF